MDSKFLVVPLRQLSFWPASNGLISLLAFICSDAVSCWAKLDQLYYHCIWNLSLRVFLFSNLIDLNRFFWEPTLIGGLVSRRTIWFTGSFRMNTYDKTYFIPILYKFRENLTLPTKFKITLGGLARNWDIKFEIFHRILTLPAGTHV